MENVEDIYALSPLQQGLLFHTLYAPVSDAYLQQWHCTLDPLNVAAFHQAWQRVVQRHAVFRTAFFWEGLDQPVQVVHREVEPEWHQEDWRGLDQQPRRLAVFLAAQRARRFQLNQAPLLRFAVLQITDTGYYFVWNYHHLLLDGWCQPLVFKEVLSFYEAFCQGRDCHSPLPQPYRDYIAWLHRQPPERAEVFWRESLEGFRSPTPLGLARGSTEDDAGPARYQELCLSMPETTVAALNALTRRERLTLNTLVQGAWALVLGCYSGERDVVFGTTVSGRPPELSGVETMMGLFINTVPVRASIQPQASLLTWLAGLQTRQAERDTHAWCSLSDIQGWSRVPRGSPLFESLLVFENYAVDEGLFSGAYGLRISDIGGFARTHYPLTVVAGPGLGGGLLLKLIYKEDCCDAETAARLLNQLQILLSGMAERPGARPGELSLFDESERHRVLVEWNATRTPYPRVSITELFERQVQRDPQATAVLFGERRLSYAELNLRANHLAHYLRHSGVGPEVLVGICMERSPDLVIGMLAILKAGGTYLPLDPDYPPPRLEGMLEDARAPVLLTQEPLRDRFAAPPGRSVVCLDTDWPNIAREPGHNPIGRTDTDHLAYVIYTSGSTGRPKGVAVAHGAIVRLLFNTNYIDLRPTDIIAQASNSSFDAATFEIWGALLHGGQVMGVPREIMLTPRLFGRYLQERRISILFLTTALFNQTVREVPNAFASLRCLLFGGEAVDPERVREVLEQGPPERLLHVYGPTESTTFATWYEVRGVPPGSATVSIGRFLSNTRGYVLDPELRPVPVGVAGELYLGGDGLARGYLNRPEITAERFIPDPFATQPGERLYRTGDRVRFGPEGGIEFIGRRDHQVKIRGFRVEPAEVEAALLQHPEVQEATVVAWPDPGGTRRLVAYVVLEPDQVSGAPELRAFLRGRLPEYMLPAAFVRLEALPLNENGKVDRESLPEPPATGPEADYQPPQSAVETIIAGLWAEVLGLDQVGIHDDFFALGGHSLLATQLVSRLREAFAVDLPLRRVFETPTVRALAVWVEDARSQTLSLPSSPICPAAGEAVLSFAQERLWFLHQLEPDNPFYNVPEGLRLQGRLHVPALERSLREISRRHQSLRSRFANRDGRPVPIIDPDPKLSLPVLDLSGFPEPEQEARRLAAEEFRRPFDLTEGPLLRVQLLRLAAEDHVLLAVMHHIVSDGWSMGILVGEISALYRAFIDDKPSPLPQLSIQYADFAHWQRQWLSGEVLERQLDYWKRQLAGAPPVLMLPSDRPRPAVQSFRGAQERFSIDADLTRALNALSQRQGATLYMTLLSSFAVLLSRYSGQEDLVLGSPIANRNRTEIEPLIGFFVNTLALRLDLSGDPGFDALLARVRHLALDAYAHQDLPFERLVEELGIERDLSRNPLFQVMFTLQNAPMKGYDLPELSVTSLSREGVSAQFDIVLDLWQTGATLTGVLEYSTDLFDADTMVRLLDQYRTLLSVIAADAHLPLSELALLRAEGRRQMLALGDGGRLDYPQEGLGVLFEKQVKADPNRLAVVHGETGLSYAELDAEGQRIARWLHRAGAGRNDLVAVLLERGCEFLAAVLGILKAGSAFLPIEPGYPPERIRHMLGDSRTPILITRARLLDKALPARHLRQVLCVDEAPAAHSSIACSVKDELAQAPEANRALRNTPDDLAYLLYTSGSTGQPKGAMVRHNGAVNHIYAQFQALDLQPGFAFLQSAPSSSDIAVWQFLAPLLRGGCTVIADFETVCDPSRLFATIRARKITLIELVPVVLQELLHYLAQLLPQKRELPDLRQAMVTGEAVSPSLVNQWLALYPSIPLINAYGPTEAADDVCQAVLSQPLPATQLTVPIGRPLANLSLYVLDRTLRLVPIGVPGEICVAGVGVGAGYWGDPERTGESFVPNPHPGHGRVLYRTGDRGRWLADGQLEFLGRLDHQVKIRGFRIELGEVEATLAQHPSVRECVITDQEDPRGERYLVAHVVAERESREAPVPIDALQAGQIALWRDLHEDSYNAAPSPPDPRFNTIGWDSTYTGQPLSEADMHEYIDHTTARVLGSHPRRVLEIGCGTGLLAFRIAPCCEQYWGTDLSRVAIRQLQSAKAAGRGLDNATFLVREADDFRGIPMAAFDAVMLCSVVQYFPGIDYLLGVLENALKALKPGGVVFLGDVRSLPLLRAYHASVQSFKADPGLGLKDLRRRIAQGLTREQELAVDPAFFTALRRRFPDIGRVDILPKRGRLHNEMTCFRYDVVLQTGEAPPPLAVPWTDGSLYASPADIRRHLEETGVEVLGLRRVPNKRVQEALQILLWLDGEPPPGASVGSLRQMLAAHTGGGIDPEGLWDLGLDYEVHLSCWESAAPGCFDAVFRRRTGPAGTIAFWDTPPDRPWRQYGNDPLQEPLQRALSPRLREFLKERLPEHMVPSDFVLLQALPLGPSGKVDREALPIPDRQAQAGYTPARNPTEETLVEIWAEVLGVAPASLGIHDNFFERGGHSLKATQVVSRIHQRLGIELPLRTLFSHSTIAELGTRIPAREPSAYGAIARIPAAAHYPVSHAQRRLWVLAQLEGGSLAYTMPGSLLLEGELDTEALARAFALLSRRHESLRTTFLSVGGELRQKVHEHREIELRRVDLSACPDPLAEARALARQDATQAFDLSAGPLVRASLLKLAEQRHVLLFCTHHIISDDWSMKVLVREYIQLYQAIRRGEAEAVLPSLSIQYRDYANWQNGLLQEAVAAPHREYWRQKLAPEIPVLDLSLDFPRPTIKTYTGAALTLTGLPGKALTALSLSHEASLFMALVALVKTLLYRYSAQQDLLIGCPVAGRDHPDLEGQIGCYLNTLVLRDTLRGNRSFGALLRQVKETATEAYDHRLYPFDRLVHELELPRDIGRSPLFDVLVVLQDPDREEPAIDGVRISPFLEGQGTSQFDLSFNFAERPDGLMLNLVYNTDLFTQQRIARMATHFETLVDAVLADPSETLARIPILPREEHRLIHDFNPTAEYPSAATLVELFESRAAETPEATAMVCGERRLSYRELNRRANRLAHRLQALGVGPEVLVGIYVERSLEMVVGLLAILKAGGAYVPFEPALPQERLRFMLQDTGVAVLLIEEPLAAGLPEHRATLLYVDAQDPDSTAAWEVNPRSGVGPEHLAYVIYTSGSTGRPKGVLVSHGNVVRLFAATEPLFRFRADDVWSLFHSYAFDFSVWELWGALLYGARVVVVPHSVSRSPEDFYALLVEQGVTVLSQTPSAFRQLLRVEEHQNRPLKLRWVIFGGEALEPRMLLPWYRRHGDGVPQLVNMYGITETTVHVTQRALSEADGKRQSSVIGSPLGDLRVYLLDAALQPLPIGVPGELYVGGAGVARGYLNRPALTAERFVPDPFSGHPGARLYRSGDLARYTSDGQLEYLGRLDHQVKVRGFRIELAEIETALAEHPAVREALVLARKEAEGLRLVAYVATGQNSAPAVTELRRFLRARLPEYMAPGAFVMLENLPLTANGKIDRRALPDPDATRPHLETRYARPRNDLEHTLATLWQEALGVTQVGIEDNFFDLGAHSLLIVQLHQRLQKYLGREIPAVSLFQYPTISSLAEYLSRGEDGGSKDFGRIHERIEKQKKARGQRRHTSRKVV